MRKAGILFILVAFCLVATSVASASSTTSKSTGNKVTGTANPGRAGNLYEQPTNLNGAYASENDLSNYGNFATTYDDFTLASNSQVTGVDWVGGYFNGTSNQIVDWTVDFYSAGALPGSLLYSTTVAGNGNETYIGLDNYGNPTYQYNVAIPTFAAAGGTQYWISVVPSTTATFAQWGQEAGTGGDGLAAQTFFGSTYGLSTDLAFGLSGSSTPEPGSLMLLGTGLLGLGGVIRRRLGR